MSRAGALGIGSPERAGTWRDPTLAARVSAHCQKAETQVAAASQDTLTKKQKQKIKPGEPWCTRVLYPEGLEK